MTKVQKSNRTKSLPRIHYIAEWLEFRGLKQVDIVNAVTDAGLIDINKGTVSKWCKGHLPSERYLLVLAEVLSVPPNDLFHDPGNEQFVRVSQKHDHGVNTTINQAIKQPRRPHHIKEWADKHNLNQSELAGALGADKGVISRWYSGSSPTEFWQKKLASFFACEPEALFRNPEENWLIKFLKDKTQEERDRAKAILRAAFPDKNEPV